MQYSLTWVFYLLYMLYSHLSHVYYFNTISCEYDVITVQNEGTIICNNNIPKNL